MRYFFHVRRGAELVQDEEGSEYSDLALVREHAVEDMRQFVGNAIKEGVDVPAEAMIVVDGAGHRVAAVPIVAVLPQRVLDALLPTAETCEPNKSEEYRQYAQECREKADNSTNPADHAEWLKLADAWLQMLPRKSSPDAPTEGWPKASDEDSQASH